MEIKIQKRLQYLKKQIQKECISYGEILELEDIAKVIELNDPLLEQWAGIEENI